MKSLLGKGIAFALAGTMVLATASCGGSGDSKTQTADSSTGSLEKVEMYTIPDPQMSAAHVIAMKKKVLMLIITGLHLHLTLHR